MKKTIALILVLALLTGLLSGCRVQLLQDPAMTEATGTGSLEELITLPSAELPTAEPDTEPTSPDEPEDIELPSIDPSQAPARLQNGGARDYLPDGEVDMVRFSEMEYVRPDSDALLASLEELTAMAERGEDAGAILEAYYAMCDAYINFHTMDTLAYIRYTLDTNDSYYKDEYDALELISSDVEEKLEAFNKACAFSPSRDALERDYFGYGYFDKYEDYSVFTNPEYLALAKREDELLADYRSALENPQVEYQGKTYTLEEIMGAFETVSTYTDYMFWLAVLEAYYTQYNTSVGEIYIELIKVRNQMAQVLGYESYADYAYEISYERDYTHEQGEAYLEQVRAELVPVYEDYENYGPSLSHFPMSGDQVSAALIAAVHNIGGRVEEAYTFMAAYELYDLRAAPEKFDSSYTTYIYNYEAPFLTINADGTSRDYVTFSHEFGHFTDNYVTYSMTEDLETAETFSQAMEFLSLCYTNGVLSEDQVRTLIRLNLADTLSTFTYQSALASFEDRVYALSDDELTIENINALYLQSCKDFGIYDSTGMLDFYYRMGWIDVTHFFEAPYYVISYVVSADTALQVYQLEKETPGAGLAAYGRLLDREDGDGVQAVMEKAGLDNPFRAGSLKELAVFFREELGLG